MNEKMRSYGGSGSSLNSNLMRAEQIIIPCDKVTFAHASHVATATAATAATIVIGVETSEARWLGGSADTGTSGRRGGGKRYCWQIFIIIHDILRALTLESRRRRHRRRRQAKYMYIYNMFDEYERVYCNALCTLIPRDFLINISKWHF